MGINMQKFSININILNILKHWKEYAVILYSLWYAVTKDMNPFVTYKMETKPSTFVKFVFVT